MLLKLYLFSRDTKGGVSGIFRVSICPGVPGLGFPGCGTSNSKPRKVLGTPGADHPKYSCD